MVNKYFFSKINRTPLGSSIDSSSTMNGHCRSPLILRRRDDHVGSDDDSTARRPGHNDDQYLYSHPSPPATLPPLVAAPDVARRQNSGAYEPVGLPAGLRGPLSLSTGVLNCSPPAPHLNRSRVRMLNVRLMGRVTVTTGSS